MAVAVAVGGQPLVADSHSIELSLIKPQAANIEPGIGYILIQLERPPQKGVDLLILPIRCYPLG
ncbi:hypothetical protein D3C76_1712510 [compost metagenome]